MFANNERQTRPYGIASYVVGSRRTRRGLTALLLVACSGVTANSACNDASVELRSGETVARFNIEVADTDSERGLGLMNREKLAASAGMLFVYGSPRHASFWMKNTLIPLDMIFVDSSGLVTKVHPMAEPLDQTPIDGGENVAFVLEINGGLANRLGITAGSMMRNPVIDQAIAVWACNSE